MSVSAETERKPKGNFLPSKLCRKRSFANFRRQNRNRSRISVGLYKFHIQQLSSCKICNILYNSIGHRFPFETFLTNAAVLNSLIWPNEAIEYCCISEKCFKRESMAYAIVQDVTNLTAAQLLYVKFVEADRNSASVSVLAPKVGK